MTFFNKVFKLLLIFLFSIILVGCLDNGVLDPKGIVSYIERQLIFDTTALMLIVIIPVIILSFAFVYHYREKNHDKQTNGNQIEYKPYWSHSHFYEGLWWAIPCLIVLGLAIIGWIYTHKLDPYRKLDYSGEVIQVQVVSLPWKWLFIYPKHDIATINHLVLPNNQQVEFFLSCDNVAMSSFFIPQLGSQIYTMAGMQTKLHLIPSELGTIKGLNSQYNGIGFSDMHFDVDITEKKDFYNWVADVKRGSNRLSTDTYQEVREPEVNVPPQYFSSVQQNIFKDIIDSYKGLEHPN